MLTKDGMAEALPAILATQEGLHLHNRRDGDFAGGCRARRDLLRDAVARLLDAGDVLRADVPADDVLMAIGGVALVAANEKDRQLAVRLADLLVEGLRR